MRFFLWIWEDYKMELEEEEEEMSTSQCAVYQVKDTSKV